MEDAGVLVPPPNQVAGHCAEGGDLGPLVDKAGWFYKPLQGNKRGQNEVEFYKRFWADDRIPPRVQDFFPRYHGTKCIESSGGNGLCEYVVIEDLTYNFRHPSVIDIKVGSRTWYPEATEEYVKKCLNKDRETTSSLLGFRVSGMQVYEASKKSTWKADRNWCKQLDIEGVRLALTRFVSMNPFLETMPDGSLASLIYGGPGCVISQLLDLKSWFEEQTYFHFSSASLLLIYESDSTDIIENAQRSDFRISIKLIDFAHVRNGQGIIDHNFLGGLCSLIKVISQIAASPGTSGLS